MFMCFLYTLTPLSPKETGTRRTVWADKFRNPLEMIICTHEEQNKTERLKKRSCPLGEIQEGFLQKVTLNTVLKNKNDWQFQNWELV